MHVPLEEVPRERQRERERRDEEEKQACGPLHSLVPWRPRWTLAPPLACLYTWLAGARSARASSVRHRQKLTSCHFRFLVVTLKLKLPTVKQSAPSNTVASVLPARCLPLSLQTSLYTL